MGGGGGGTKDKSKQPKFQEVFPKIMAERSDHGSIYAWLVKSRISTKV